MDEAWMEALRELGLQNCAYTLLQEKDGIRVARVWRQGAPYIIKFFQAADFRREIANYRILAALGVPTLKVHAQTSSALLLEDAAHSPLYRLGTPEDLRDPAVARRIADWYRLLHQKGYAYAARHGADLYDETSVFTREAIAQIQQNLLDQIYIRTLQGEIDQEKFEWLGEWEARLAGTILQDHRRD